MAKALSELNHPIFIWDYLISPTPPDVNYDLAIVQKGNIDTAEKLKSPKVLIWFEDPAFIKFLYDVKDKYDKVYEIIDLQMGCDKDTHKSLNIEKKIDVCFIGTNRYEIREKLVRFLSSSFKRFAVFGNGWGQNIEPVYFKDFNLVCNSSKIIIGEHFSPLYISTKDCEIPACGGGLYISDENPIVRKMYPSVPMYKDLDDLAEKIKYYLTNEEERLKLVKELQKIAYEKFSYKTQLSKILANGVGSVYHPL